MNEPKSSKVMAPYSQFPLYEPTRNITTPHPSPANLGIICGLGIICRPAQYWSIAVRRFVMSQIDLWPLSGNNKRLVVHEPLRAHGATLRAIPWIPPRNCCAQCFTLCITFSVKTLVASENDCKEYCKMPVASPPGYRPTSLVSDIIPVISPS